MSPLPSMRWPSFSKSPNSRMPPIDETSPLLQPHSLLPTISEDDEDALGTEGTRSDNKRSSTDSISRKFSHGISVGHSARGGIFLGDRTYLPLHRRRRRAYANDPPAWRVLFNVVGALALLGCIIASCILLDTIRYQTGPYPAPPCAVEDATLNPAYLIKAKNGAVASENIVCSNIGIDVLKEGGNAVDAAIASTFCIGVVNLFSSGIGGGGFMTVRIPPTSINASSEVWTIDFRETAPEKSNTTMYINNPNASKFGGLAVGVPGELRGLQEAHKRWGSMPWKRLVQPSVDLAAGWPVGRELAKKLPSIEDLIDNVPVWRDIFAPNGTILREGELVRRTLYSQTLATIASEGPDAFYEGPIADAIINIIQETGGIMAHKDLEGYRVKVTPALQGTYRGRKVYTPHAPSSGPVLLHMLNLLENYDLAGEGRTGLNVHRLIEVLKFGFAARTRLCDPAFTNDTARINVIPKKSYGRLIAANITDDTTHPSEYYNPIFDVPLDSGTSHTSVIDKNGMAVALTSTVNIVFGSRVMDPVTGVLLNDEMDDFSTPGEPNAFGLWPSPFNYPEPGKRPLSSTTPTIIENPDGSFHLAIGASGGSLIFGAVLQVILGLDEWGLDVSQAIESGRVHDQLYPPTVMVDSRIPEVIVDALEERRHNVTIVDGSWTAIVQAVEKTGDLIYAASDSRKNGIAAGY